MSTISKITESKHFNPVVAILWAVAVSLILYNTYLSIKINKKKLSEEPV
jgi:hypothetical protein